MLKESLVSLIMMGGIALLLLTFTGSQHVRKQSKTTTVAQVVKEFNDTKHIRARSWNVSAESIPEISEQEVLASLVRLYAASKNPVSDTSSAHRQTLETAICMGRLPRCTHIRVTNTGVADSPALAQLELRFGRSENHDWYLDNGNLSSFTVPVTL